MPDTAIQHPSDVTDTQHTGWADHGVAAANVDGGDGRALHPDLRCHDVDDDPEIAEPDRVERRTYVGLEKRTLDEACYVNRRRKCIGKG